MPFIYWYILMGVFSGIEAIVCGYILGETKLYWKWIIMMTALSIVVWPLRLVYLVGLAIYLRTRKPPQKLDMAIVDL